jgi:peptidoglycan/xylan/chitin deacetylase (PgdA/CDA1 family)
MCSCYGKMTAGLGKISAKVLLALVGAMMTFLISASGASAQQVSSGVPVLLYHRFGPVAGSTTVTTAVFEEQLAWLREHNRSIISLRTVVDSLRNPGATLPPGAVTITVDDGHRSVYTEMFPLIKRYRFPVTLFIYPSAISNAWYALTWDQLAEMVKSGFVDVQSHTYWHPDFRQERARLPPDAYRAFVLTQLTRSKEVLSRHLGVNVDMLAWPFGIYDPELEQWAALAGYTAAFTVERRPVIRGENMLALPRFMVTDLDRGARFAAVLGGAADSQVQR